MLSTTLIPDDDRLTWGPKLALPAQTADLATAPDVAARTQVRKLALQGACSAGVIAIAGGGRVWPFFSLTDSPWWFQFEFRSWPLRYLVLLAFFLGVAGLCWSWSRLVSLCRRSALPVSWMAAVFAAWALPLCMAAPLLSGDVYVYDINGQALARGFDPYSTGVSAMGPDSMVHLVHPIWRATTTMYGPLFMRTSQAVVRLTGGQVIAGILVFRALAVLSVLIMAAGAVSIGRRLGREPGLVLAMTVLNPVVLLHLIGGAHNDGTMLGLLIAGVAVGLAAMAVRLPWSWLLRLTAIGLCVAGAAVKIPAFVGVLVLGWIWAGAAASLWRRVCWSAAAGVIGLGLLAELTALSGLGWGWVHSYSVPGIAHPVLAPANAVAMSIGGLFGVPLGVNSVTRLVAEVIAGVVGIWLVMRTRKSADLTSVLRGVGWALLLVGWMGPAVYPWYLTWGLVVIGITGAGDLQRVLQGVVIALCFVVMPGGYGTFDLYYGWLRTGFAFVAVALMAWACRAALQSRRISPRSPAGAVP